MPQQPPGTTRLRLLGVLSLLFLAGWAWAAWWIWDVYLPHLELSALFGFFMASSMGAGHQGTNNAAAPPIDAAAAVAVRHIWFALMCLIGAVMGVAGVAGLAGARWSHRVFMAAGLLILAGTAATMGGIVVLIHKARFPATITALGYGLLCVIQSFPGWVLLLASVGGRRGRATRRSAAGPLAAPASSEQVVERGAD